MTSSASASTTTSESVAVSVATAIVIVLVIALIAVVVAVASNLALARPGVWCHPRLPSDGVLHMFSAFAAVTQSLLSSDTSLRAVVAALFRRRRRRREPPPTACAGSSIGNSGRGASTTGRRGKPHGRAGLTPCPSHGGHEAGVERSAHRHVYWPTAVTTVA